MNPQIHALAVDAAGGRWTPAMVLISGGVGRGKTFTARVVTRWAHAREAAARVARCPVCANERQVKRGNGYGACECTCRRPFTVEHVFAYRVGDAARSLLTLFTLVDGFDDRADAARGRLADLLGCSLLIIDDLGSERNPPPTFESALASLVEQRAEVCMPTWVITNNSPEEIAARYGARNYSRIVNAAEPITITGRDRRKRNS